MSADPQAAYLAALIEHGLLIPTGVDGLYGRSGLFEDVVDRFNALISSWGGKDGAEILRFPPALNRTEFERSDYLTSFPQLAGSVHSFCGHDSDHRALLDKLKAGDDWSTDLKATKLVLTPAACYPVYPTVAARGPLPPEGRLIDVYSYCFRHEPSIDPARMQLFRMREYVRIGSAEQVTEFRQTWLTRGQELIASLELPLKLDIANDPFFGRAGKMLAANQRDQSLKFELLVPITREDAPTACLSFNYHQDHFGRNWQIQTAELGVAHSACVGFGMERVVLALFKHHGFKLESWPTSVRDVLWS